jgi:hypothetical protein
MRSLWPGLLWLGLVLTFMACRNQPPPPLSFPERHYFAQTDQTVQGEFYYFYQKYGGVESLGYPLTAEMMVDGWRVQYFERGRLEYHPENDPRYRVTVGWLGDLLNRRRPPLPAEAIPPAHLADRHYFPETGHTLSGDFLRYYRQHGGSVRFGLPISEPFLLEGRLSQDFQSARFYWNPTTTPPITLEKIGETHLKYRRLVVGQK